MNRQMNSVEREALRIAAERRAWILGFNAGPIAAAAEKIAACEARNGPAALAASERKRMIRAAFA